jgi:arginine/lysine/ornithine decarboxylase
MPGHKRNKTFIPDDLLMLDMTEVGELDNLHHPTGIIKDAEDLCAKVYGSQKSFFSTCGATVCVLAAVCAVCKPNENIIVMRNSHKSLYNALELSGAVPIYLYQNDFFGINYGIDLHELENILKSNINIKSVFITNPNYEGFYFDTRSVAKLCHLHKKILIVDESHGSHFNFSDQLPDSAIKCGADIVINSLHKNLPTLTQSAVLHVNSSLIHHEQVKKFISIFHTTSPSYITMSIIESCLKKLACKNFFEKYIDEVIRLRKKLSSNKIIKLIDKKIMRKEIKENKIKDIDITKLSFLINSVSQPNKIEKILYDDYKIQIELYGINHILALSSVADCKHNFDALEKSLSILERRLSYKAINYKKTTYVKNKMILTPREALLSDKKYININKSVGKICGEPVIAYPPGTCLIVPGEIITTDIIELINLYINESITIIGLKHMMMCVCN